MDYHFHERNNLEQANEPAEMAKSVSIGDVKCNDLACICVQL
jgi:hypothetical protein